MISAIFGTINDYGGYKRSSDFKHNNVNQAVSDIQKILGNTGSVFVGGCSVAYWHGYQVMPEDYNYNIIISWNCDNECALRCERLLSTTFDVR